MTGRERLIELLAEFGDDIAFCDICKRPNSDCCDACRNERLADYLLDHGVIVLPCKVRDMVYKVEYDTEKCNNCIFLSTDGSVGGAFCELYYSLYPEPNEGDEDVCPKHKLIVKPNRFSVFFTHSLEDFGKTIFLTREEAERALKNERRSGKGTQRKMIRRINNEFWKKNSRITKIKRFNSKTNCR